MKGYTTTSEHSCSHKFFLEVTTHIPTRGTLKTHELLRLFVYREDLHSGVPGLNPGGATVYLDHITFGRVRDECVT